MRVLFKTNAIISETRYPIEIKLAFMNENVFVLMFWTSILI